MKWIILLLAFVACSVRASEVITDDLTKLANAYFAGVGLTKPEEAIKCMKDTVWNEWASAMKNVEIVTDWKDLAEMLIGLTFAIKPFVETIRVAGACSKEADVMYQTIANATNNIDDFLQTLISNADMIGPGMKDAKTAWDAKNYASVGQVTGVIAKLIFKL